MLREHSGPSPQFSLSANPHKQSRDAPPLDAATQKRVQANLAKLPSGAPEASAWMEVCDFTLSLDQGVHDDDHEEDAARRFELLFVCFYATCGGKALAYFADDSMRQPLGVMALPERESCEFIDDPPFNYEHALAVPPGAPLRSTWWLCPDTEKDTRSWMMKLNKEYDAARPATSHKQSFFASFLPGSH